MADVRISDPVSAAIAGVSDLIKAGIDKIWPDPRDEAAARVALLKATVEAEVTKLEAVNRAANAEAASADPWTSRARPSFLYVMYFMILFSIPMGVLSAFKPEIAALIADGMKAWLNAVPETLWGVMAAMFSVYSAGRSWEKVRGASR